VKNLDEARRQYLQDPFSTRLARLAANLQRIASFLEKQDSDSITELIDECRQSLEWSAPDLRPDRVEDAAYLVDVQRGLTRWKSNWDQVQANSVQRQQLIEQAREWSVEILYISGLVDE
jgi:hypothetical protein